ncbi:MAG: L-threonylcarbamoyladenylate synthase [Candidatus Aminicenantes bacterium]|nr:L-threonylcarbamoyladenylate synthase [Candidatus Aminicenantes bacterium]
MKTRITKIETQSVMPKLLHDIVRVLDDDGVIAYPTETFYGLGGNCFSRKVLKKIFKIKNRPVSKGLPVLVSDLGMARILVSDLPPTFHDLAARFWPGPLTLVLSAAPHLPVELVGPKRTIGIRLPDVPWLLALIRETGVPLITTSANISGEGEIASPEEVIRLFQEKVDLIVDGGPTPGGKPSTVVDLTGEKPVLVRKGVIGHKELGKFV